MKKKILIIGAGFGGLTAAKNLADTEFEITLIDKTNHHLFQPLLYQVATAALSPSDIAVPIRSLLSDNKNIKVILDEVISIDKNNHIVNFKDSQLEFDYLIVAVGARHSYFGKNEWEQLAPGLKTLTDALVIREKIIEALELAEKETNHELMKKYLTFVIVGGGPTGVELAGAIAEIAKETMIKDYKNFRPEDTKVFLIEAMDRILSSFDKKLSEQAKEDLMNMGVEVKLNAKVENISQDGVHTNQEFIPSKTIIWAAGNQASPLLKSLNVETDRAGRVIVKKDCSIPGNPEIFLIGDAAHFEEENGNVLPGVAQVAIQQGKFVAEVIKNQIPPERRPSFRYKDKGTMATIGKAKAVAEIKGLKLSGVIAWLAWSIVHIFFLIGFRNRFRVMIEWIWYYITKRHGTRLIVGK
ncbi:NADH dehydrogenase [Ignavibacterium album JCM 16511]|uniref:NADH:ubiquinone reductase (non-electrogenic) n=1 Tax=Ignavibacterium album (strain DSM 19864 / JCM 16511 / NBRC 101810 / Mat9-16) TaxID=945713 RepID=I0AKG5_IGNAJ|nr:NAD(P)/FAD-dependent oxidoreductase [Ignavibacterium album]AFH49472.1 NADH dehydrogenase [Ignavibacterium album JCM 16511]